LTELADPADRVVRSETGTALVPQGGRDPALLLAAERTLLAWQRSAIALMGFGLVVERSGLLIDLATKAPDALHRTASLAVGVFLICIGGGASYAGMRQFRLVLRAMDPAAIPAGYRTFAAFGVGVSLVVAAAALLALLLLGA
jgi:putative membrane protein